MRDIVQIFKALSDETRLRILCLLSQHELCVCELVDILGMAQSRISHQLQILKSARLVNDRREGKWIVYSLNTQDGYAYHQQIFEILEKTLNQDQTVREDGDRLKLCQKKGVRERCRTVENGRK